MKEVLRANKPRFFLLMTVVYVVFYFGLKDAVGSTVVYNKLNVENPIDFKIEDKYNKRNGKWFPDLNFAGKILSTGKEIEIKVSKGDYDTHLLGQTIKVFSTGSGEFMTEYEIKNQGIIHISGVGFSFVFFPVFIFYMLGFIAMYVVFRL